MKKIILRKLSGFTPVGFSAFWRCWSARPKGTVKTCPRIGIRGATSVDCLAAGWTLFTRQYTRLSSPSGVSINRLLRRLYFSGPIIVFGFLSICSSCIINYSLADETTAPLTPLPQSPIEVSSGEETTTQLAQLPQSPIEVSSGKETTALLTPLPQSPAGVSPMAGGMQTRISLDLRNIEIVEALKFLSMKAGLNIITTKNVSGRITLLVQDVPLQDIFDVMLRSNGLAYTRAGDIYNVMTDEEYRAIFGKKFADVRQVRVFRLKYAIPDQAFTLLDTLKSEIGRVLVEPDSGTVLVMDTPEKTNEIELALATFEKANLVRVFNLKYARAKDIEDQLKTQLDGKKVGSIKADERSNQVIVQTLPERMPGIEALITSLDKKTLEVLIDAKIIKVKLSNQLTAGVEWEGLFNTLVQGYGLNYVGSYPFSVMQAAADPWQSRKVFADANKATGIGAYPFSGNTDKVASSTKTVLGEKVHVGIIDRVTDIDAVINYLETLGNTQVLSNPKLAVVNNQEAKIHVGERQAYVTSTVTQGQSTSTVSEEVTFVDVGISLSVTAIINEDGYVTMKVKPEISSVVDTLLTPTGNKIPIIDSSSAETTVMVKGGSTIIIGGLRREDKVSISKQVPFLGRIPLLGFLFKSSSDKTERTEILVMLTPHIISGDILTTGDEKDFGAKQGKGVKEYSNFTKGLGFKSSKAEEVPVKEKILKGLPENEIKPYREYQSLERRKNIRLKI